MNCAKLTIKIFKFFKERAKFHFNTVLTNHENENKQMDTDAFVLQ